MKLLKYTFLLIITLASNACISDLFEGNQSIAENNSIKLSFICDDIQHYQIGTKAAVDKNDKETEIKSLYVFFFDASGNALQLNQVPEGVFGTEGSATYIQLGTKTVETLSSDYFGTSASSAQIYAVANLDGFSPASISDLQSLLDYEYAPESEEGRNVSNIPTTGMPMFGSAEGTVNLTGNTARTVNIKLKALMAKVEFSVGINSSNSDVSNTYPRMFIQKWTIGNKANGIVLGNTGTTSFGDKIIKTSPEMTKTVEIRQGGGYHTETFYLFENKQGAKTWEEVEEDLEKQNITVDMDFVDGLKDSEKERYKSLRANDHASYIMLDGIFHGADKGQTAANLTFYFGSNNTDNFELKRNCHYNNVVTITGLVSNKDHEYSHVLYDSRVETAGTEATPYFLSVLREHDIDAHFGVTPIDFYFYPNESVTAQRIIVEVENPNEKNWIRMEKIEARYMEDSTLPNTMSSTHIDAGTGSWLAGHGKRKYFTTDLVTNTLKNSYSCEVTNHRDRVYLYIDENISINSRTATVKVTYQIKTDDRNEWHTPDKVETRKIDITQRGLLEVAVHEDASDMNSDIDHYIYIEYIEEYLDNYDPYDMYTSNQVYQGLWWSEKDFYIVDGFLGIYSNTWSNAYFEGSEVTQRIINKGGYQVMALNDQPRSAAEYCYNKNKRNSSGNVTATLTTSGWFLPHIRQLENIMTQHQNLFPSLRTEFYWSSAPGKRGSSGGREDMEYARATRYDYLDEVPTADYVESGENHTYPTYTSNGKKIPGGKADKQTLLRIRAAYYPPNGARLTN